MSEDPSTDPLEDDDQPRPEPTGVERVDAVVDQVAGLDGRPLEEHLAVLERAHTELRRTLDDPQATQQTPAQTTG